MSLGLRIGSMVNWMQNNRKIDKYSFLSSDQMIPIKFTETLQNVLKIHIAFKTYHINGLSICPRKVKDHLNAYFAK